VPLDVGGGGSDHGVDLVQVVLLPRKLGCQCRAFLLLVLHLLLEHHNLVLSVGHGLVAIGAGLVTLRPVDLHLGRGRHQALLDLAIANHPVRLGDMEHDVQRRLEQCQHENDKYQNLAKNGHIRSPMSSAAISSPWSRGRLLS